MVGTTSSPFPGTPRFGMAYASKGWSCRRFLANVAGNGRLFRGTAPPNRTFSMTQSLAGNLLVASTTVEDPIVNRGVCLLVHDDTETAIGVMLNRPMRPSPQQLLSMLGESDGKRAESPGGRHPSADRGLHAELVGPEADNGKAAVPPGLAGVGLPGGSGALPTGGDSPATTATGALHFGGPLSGPVVAIHASSEYAEAETGPGIYVAAQKHHLEYLVRHHPVPYRLIVGHLGWTGDQLRSEISRGLWHVLPATPELVFAAEGDLWPQLIRRATASTLADWLGTTDVPDAAELN